MKLNRWKFNSSTYFLNIIITTDHLPNFVQMIGMIRSNQFPLHAKISERHCNACNGLQRR